jgi:hypothetical protein
MFIKVMSFNYIAITKNWINKLFVSGKVVYHKIPVRLRFVFYPIKLIYKHIISLRLDLWIIKGEEIKSKQDLVITYAGSKENKNFFIKLAFGTDYNETYVGKAWCWKIFSSLKEKSYSPSLMVAEVPKKFRILFGRKKKVCIPCLIIGETDISSDISLLCNNSSIKSDLRRIKNKKLYFEVTNSISQFDNFYHNMYIPYITRIHGNSSIIMEYDRVKKEFKNCELLLIKQNEREYIGGILLSYAKDSARLWSLGIKDGNLEYIKDGAVGALYYFSIDYLKKRRLQKISLGWTRSFLNDGILRYKKKWGFRIAQTYKSLFIIEPLLKTDAVKGFFLNNPFIYISKEKFCGAIFEEDNQYLSGEQIKSIYKNYYLTGMSKLFIYCFRKDNINRSDIVPPELSEKITICPAESLFNYD